VGLSFRTWTSFILYRRRQRGSEKPGDFTNKLRDAVYRASRERRRMFFLAARWSAAVSVHRPACRTLAVETRQTVLPTSSATSKAPRPSRTTPTGRPYA